jgi:hypothetical protein
VQPPSEDLTTVRPSELELDMLVEPVPGPACVDTEGPAPVVEPDTAPLPAWTDVVMPPAEDIDVFGGFSPDFRKTVLQLPLSPEEDDVLPSEDAELDELLLSACAAAATTTTRAAAQKASDFIAKLPSKRQGGPKAALSLKTKLVLVVVATLMLPSILAALFSVLASAPVRVVEPGRSCSGPTCADRRSRRALAG